MKVLGRTLTSAGLPGVFDRWLDDEWAFPASADALDSDWHVHLMYEPAPVPQSVVDAPKLEGEYGTLHLRCSPRQSWILKGSSGVSTTILDGAATVTAHGEPFDAWIALHCAVTEALCVSGVIRLHASAISADGRTMMFLGPSGRGKSTTLLRGLLAGYRPVAEDGCWLDPSSLRLFGLDRGVRLLPDALQVLLEARPDTPTTPSGAGKVAVSFDDLGGAIDGQVLTDLVLLERNPEARTGWSELSDTHAVLSLYEAIGAPHSDAARRMVSGSLADIVSGTTCSLLTLGSETPTF